MCDINVYLYTNGSERLVLENVDEVASRGDETRVSNIFGEERVFSARLAYYRNSEKKMVFVPVSDLTP
ncbi:MAG: CooT family nickel-binding protein [Desulfobacterales bacterium]